MTYNNPKAIAILLAAYNAEKFLAEQVDSLISQTNQDWTLYIRNDGSTDSTAQIIGRYCEQYPDRIIEIDRGGKNLGCRDNFFRLLEVVESDYYMFCDADDYWLPKKIEVSYNFLKEKESQYPGKPILVHCDKIMGDENLNITSQSGWKTLKFDPDIISSFNHIPLRIVGGASSMFNNAIKSEYLVPSPFPTAHDGWVALQTARYGKIFAIHQALMIYRQHSASTTFGDNTHTSLWQYFKKIFILQKWFKHHNEFASQMQTLEYGGKIKYFYYRIVVFSKIIWGRLTY